jgi:hypothetical protein
VAGYYYASGDSGFQIKAVAWPNGVFTPLEMPAGQRYAFPSAVGMNGMVFGSATDGQTGRSVPGFWQLDIEGTTLRSTPVSGARGQTVQLAAESVRSSGANVGYSVAARVNGAIVGQSVTNSQGKATVSFTIPQSATGSQLTVQFKDETGATTTTVIQIESACAAADINCDTRVNAQDLAALLSAWGQSGAADLNRDGSVNAPDLAVLLSGWTG